MPNRGLVVGQVRYDGAPVQKARVGIRNISAAGQPLYYWNHKWFDEINYSRNVPAVYINTKGVFLIPFHWAATDAGGVFDG